jgi:hypothetical protein
MLLGATECDDSAGRRLALLVVALSIPPSCFGHCTRFAPSVALIHVLPCYKLFDLRPSGHSRTELRAGGRLKAAVQYSGEVWIIVNSCRHPSIVWLLSPYHLQDPSDPSGIPYNRA